MGFDKNEINLVKFPDMNLDFSKQEIELFFPLSGPWSMNFFYKTFLIWSKVFKINFQNRKKTYFDLFLPILTHLDLQGESKKWPPQLLLNFSGYKHAWKGGIHSFVWSTQTFLYDIREPRYKEIKMGYQITKCLKIGKSRVLKNDTALIYV